MQIAFYKFKHGDELDHLIGLTSFSQYSHCELVFSDGMCGTSSFRDGGIRLKNIGVNNDHWDVFDVETDMTEAQIRYWFFLHNGENYDWIGAISSIFYFNPTSTLNKWFCSEVCGVFTCSKNNLNPGALFRYLKKTGKIK